jgi:DNA-binding transcriptional ArsR family regulator
MNTPEQLQASAGEAAALLKAMSHPSRLLILCMLCDAPGTSAGELARITGLSPPQLPSIWRACVMKA